MCAPPGSRVWVTVVIIVNVQHLMATLSAASETHGQADNPVLVLSEVFYIMRLPHFQHNASIIKCMNE